MRGRLFLEWLLVAGLAVASVCLLVGQRLTERANNVVYDKMLALRPQIDSEVLIVAIDEASLAEIGRWPWRREVHAALLRRLAAAHPKAIGYDVLFVEPGPDDAALAAAAKQAGNVVLPMTFVVPGANGAPFGLQLPVAPIAQAVRVGHADLIPEGDGIVRRVSLLAGGGDAVWPQIAEQLYRLVRGRPSPAFVRTTAGGLPPGKFGFSRPILLPFSGPAGHHASVSFARVLNGEVLPELLRDRVVLIGSTAAGSGDQYPVPSGAMPGVEILANSLDALLADRTIGVPGPGAALALAFVPLGILLVALLLLPPRVNVVLGLALIAATLATSAALLHWADLWVPPVPALAGLMIVYPLWAWRRLEAASAYMGRELRQLHGETDRFPVRAPAAARARLLGEAILQQSALLHLAIGRVRDLRRFFADTLQALPDATVVLDEAGALLVANRAAETLFGPVAAGVTLDALLASLAAKTMLDEDGQREITTADGRVFVLRMAPLLDAQGRPAGSIARLTEITAIRLATRQREDALQLLTHDMRSPQASILALLDRPAGDDGNLRKRIAGYAQRTLDLADNFVQLARAESGARADELLDLAILLIEAADDQWPLASRKGIRIDADPPDEEYLVRGDRSLLSRMLVNLIGNAVKYSGADTVVRCSVGREEDIVCCRIADQGKGIPDDQRERIFDRFSRVTAGRAQRDVGGAGLGLAFVQTVVARHGGTIACESEEEIGTVFIVRLPAAFDPEQGDV